MTTPLARYTGYHPIRGTSEGADVIPKLDDNFENTLRDYIKSTPQNRGKTIKQRLTNEDTWDKYRCLVGEEEMQPLSYLYGNGFAEDSSAFSGLASGSDKVAELGGGADSIRWTARMAITQALNYVSDNDLIACINDLSEISEICDGNPGCLIIDQCVYDSDSTDNSLCKIPRSWAGDECEALKVHLICTEFHNAAAKIDVYVEHTEKSIKKIQVWSDGYPFAGSQWGQLETASEPGVTGGLFIAGGVDSGSGMVTGNPITTGQTPEFVEFTIKTEKLPWMETPNEGDRIKVGTFWLADAGGINSIGDAKIRIEGLGCDKSGNNVSKFPFTTTNRMDTAHEDASGSAKDIKLIQSWGCFGMTWLYTPPFWGLFFVTNLTYLPNMPYEVWNTRVENWKLYQEFEADLVIDTDQVTFLEFENALREIDATSTSTIEEQLGTLLGSGWLLGTDDPRVGEITTEVIDKSTSYSESLVLQTTTRDTRNEEFASFENMGDGSNLYSGDGGYKEENVWMSGDGGSDGGTWANEETTGLAKDLDFQYDYGSYGLDTNLDNDFQATTGDDLFKF